MYDNNNFVVSLGHVNYKGNDASIRVYKLINSYSTVIIDDAGFVFYEKVFNGLYPNNWLDAMKHAETLEDTGKLYIDDDVLM